MEARKSIWRRAVDKIGILLPGHRQPAIGIDDYGCVEVTQANFDDVVIRNNKDVLIEFHIPEVLNSNEDL
jgi:hypothetical protein